MDDLPPIILDSGSGTTMIGFGGEERPRAEIPSMLGKPKVSQPLPGMGAKDNYIGREANNKRGVLSLDYPISHSKVKDWEGLEQLWKHCFYQELKVSPQEHRVLLTEPSATPRQNRSKAVQLLFEKFEIPGLYIGNEDVLGLYGSGSTSGLVVNSGEGSTRVVPVMDGYILTHAIKKSNLGGQTVTDYLIKLLLDGQGISLSSSPARQLAQHIKENCCFVTQDLDKQLARFQSDKKDEKNKENNKTKDEKKQSKSKKKDDDDEEEEGEEGEEKAEGEGEEEGEEEEEKEEEPLMKIYQCPDGTEIKLEREMFLAPEVLFSPYVLGAEGGGLHELCYQSIMSCGIDVRPSLYSAILLMGGNTLMKGFHDRLWSSLQKIVPSTITIDIIGTDDRQYLPWLGGSALSMTTLSVFNEMWISKQDYQEYGASVAFKKCF